jgi:formylglycine-generating enzyme required for sulfatase activity
MKTLNLWLWYATVALLTAAKPVSAQTPPNLGLRLFAGVSITGTVGSIYAVQSTSDLAQTNSWRTLAFLQLPVTNYLFVDTSGPVQGNRFYRALLQTPPTNMVFIRPNTFKLGSPTNEVGHGADESPQTIVTVGHGFWMGKHEVTQGEYLAVVGSNPSQFTGDPNRPVESVSWPEATNYCALLTAQHLATGVIPPGSQYRLPTEAEWEYAARAGTSTRFSYGEDPNATSLTNYAWFAAKGGATTHPVEQKAPNPWGLYDMAGNFGKGRTSHTEKTASPFQLGVRSCGPSLVLTRQPGWGPRNLLEPNCPL